jgi:RNA polymerase sigma-70 factor (ECF subfamily)
MIPLGDKVAADPARDQRTALIEKLFREHNQSLVRFLIARLNSEQEAREVAQEAYVRLLQLDQPEAVGFLRQFLFKTALNIATDRIRHRQVVKANTSREWFDLNVDPSAHDRLVAQQEVQIIEEALAKLDKKCREAFILNRLGGYKTAEIAQRMGITDRMVRMHLIKAALHCREYLDRADEPSKEGELT